MSIPKERKEPPDAPVQMLINSELILKGSNGENIGYVTVLEKNESSKTISMVLTDYIRFNNIYCPSLEPNNIVCNILSSTIIICFNHALCNDSANRDVAGLEMRLIKAYNKDGIRVHISNVGGDHHQLIGA